MVEIHRTVEVRSSVMGLGLSEAHRSPVQCARGTTRPGRCLPLG